MRQGTARAKSCLERAQQRQKTYADWGHWDASYEVGEDLMLSTMNVRHRSPGSPKFMPGWMRPYRVLKRVGEVAYRLALPVELKMHPVFQCHC